MSRALIAFFLLCLILQNPALARSQPAAAPKPASPLDKVVDFFEDFYNNLIHPQKEPDPSSTLIAPFADQAQLKPLTAQEKTIGVLAAAKTPLDQSHRSAEDLGKWLMQAIPACLSFSADSYSQHLQILGDGFSDSALAQFKAWIDENGIVATMQSNDLQINGFVNEPPFLLNEGVINGRYRWLFEVPVMIGFVPKGSTGYSRETSVRAEKMLLTVQLGRVENSLLEHGIEIESWSLRSNQRKN